MKNEPAYPLHEEDRYGNPLEQHFGLSKRECFAGLALQALPPPVFYNGVAETEKELNRHAARAVKMADALLKALEAGNSD